MESHCRPHERRRRSLTVIARVVPDLATFAVDDGFAYTVPESVTGIEVGSIVRAPLGGRTVRGYVTSVRQEEPQRALRPIKARSGAATVFDEPLLRTAQWAATHYVAPLAAFLRAASPPNLPKRVTHPSDGSHASVSVPRPRYSRPRYVVTGRGYDKEIEQIAAPVLDRGGNVIVVVPTAAECEALAARQRGTFGERVLTVTSSLGDAEVTSAWSALRLHGGLMAVGTREVALWHGGDLQAVVVVEEGRRAMKARRTPTWHVRDVVRKRSIIERFSLTFIGPVPTLEAAAGAELFEPRGRVWPLVEIADRGEDPPGSSIVTERTKAAISGAVKGQKRAFVLVPYRGYSRAMACVACGTIRVCPTCGASVERSGECPRCSGVVGDSCVCGSRRFRAVGAGVGSVVESLQRVVGGYVGEVGSGSPIEVGTERDLVDVGSVDLSVAIDLDGRILAPNYRAGEDALRVAARLALKVPTGRGRRCLIQTSLPDDPVFAALRSGRPMPFLDMEMRTRRELNLPPKGELLALEIRDADPTAIDRDVRAAASDAVVRGPAGDGSSGRWLIQAADLGTVKVRLRALCQTLRDQGTAVRVDVDPIDL